MRYRLYGISAYGLDGLGKGDEHPYYTFLYRSMAPLAYLTFGYDCMDQDCTEHTHGTGDILTYHCMPPPPCM